MILKKEEAFMGAACSADINGFTLKNVKQIPADDGYVTSAVLYYRGKKLGDYFYDGMGGLDQFSPAKGCSREWIEEYLRSYPKVECNDPEGPLPPVHWDIGILVSKIIWQNTVLKSFRKAQKKGRVLLEASSDIFGINVFYHVTPEQEDCKAMDSVRVLVEKEYPIVRDFSYTVYRKEEEANIIIEDVPELSFPGRSASV